MKIFIGICSSPSKKNYFEILNTCEIQETFYSVPDIKKAENIRKKIEKFKEKEIRIFLKAPQHITHPENSPTYRRCKKDYGKRENYGFFKNTEEVKKAWEEIYKFAEKLKAHGIVFQTPASFSENVNNIENIYSFIEIIKGSPFLIFWEPRGKWSKNTLKRIFKNLKINHATCIFQMEPLTKNPLYLRLHGKPMYKYRFKEEDFKKIKDYLKNSKESFILFNNIYMWEDAIRFKKYISKEISYKY